MIKVEVTHGGTENLDLCDEKQFFLETKMSIKMFTATAFCFSLLHDSPVFVQTAGISQFHSFREAKVSKFK